MRRFSVALRLLVLFSLLFALFAGLAAIGVTRLNRLMDRVSHVEQHVTPLRGLTNRLVTQARAQTAAVHEMQAPYLKSPAVYSLYQDRLAQLRATLRELKQYADSVPRLPDVLLPLEAALSAVERGPMMTRPFPTTLPAQQARGNEEEPLARALEAAVVRADEAAQRWQNEAISKARLLASRTQRDLVSFALAAGFLGLVLSLLAARSVTRPVARLLAATQSVAAGNLDVQVGDTGQDELASLARNFNWMTQRLAESRAQLEHYTQDLQRHAQQLESRTQELQAVNTELEAFTYSVSHDLRAPLRHMDGFSRLLLEEHSVALSDEARRYLTRIREATRQMGQLVDDLLNLAGVGRQELKRQLTGLDSLVEQVATQLKREHASRSIEWKIQPLPFLHCDPALMKQVFANLLSNAVKFTRPREQTVIEVGALTQDAQPVIFVRDNGVGFDMKYADKLFGVFQRLHRPEDFEGTGVGLATVQRIIHKHGGRVWAEAEVNRGATFYFTLGQTPTQSPEPTR